MAENLGVAQLSLDVDLKGLEAGLQKAKQQIERFSVQGIKLDFGSADQQFRRLEASAKVFEAQLRKLSTTPLNLNASGLGKLGADAQKAGADLSAFTRGVINGDRALANNIAGLQQQGAAFRTLAANVKIGTAEFRNFTQAAAQAGQKQLFAGFEEIKSLESLFKLGGSGGQSSFKGTEQLLAFASRIGSTPAAINLYVQALKQAQSLTSTSDANFAKLTAEISRQRQALEQAAAAAERYGKSLKAPQLALPPGRGPSQFTFTGPTAEELAAEERNRRRQAKIGARIDYFSTGGRSTPDAGFLARPDAAAIKAEQELQRQRQRTANVTEKAAAKEKGFLGGRGKDVLSNALIGGAFPLLFGQGAGASAGGLLGGAAGGLAGGQFGFGGSLVGTAVGAQIDAAIQKLQALGTALQDPVGSFTALQQAALLSSKGVEKNVEALIAAGRQEEASAAIRADLTASFGDVSGATALNKALDELQRTWSALGVAVVSFTSGPLSDFIEKLNQGLRAGLELSQDERLNIQRRAEAAVSDKANLLQQSGFFGAISVPFEGKTFTGSAAGVRQEIIAQLEKELLLQKQNAREEKARQQYTTETADVVARRGELLDTENALLVANANNDKSRTLELQKQKLILEQNLALGNLPANASDITRNEIRLDFAQKILAVETQIRNLPAAGSTGQLESSLQKANEALSRLRVNADSINFRSAVADVAGLEAGLRAAQGAIAGVKADVLSAGIAAGDFANSFENVNSVLQNLEQFRGTLDIDSSAFVNATADILQTQDQLQQLDGKKATIEIELLRKGLEDGSIEDTLTNRQKLEQAFLSRLRNTNVNDPSFALDAQRFRNAQREREDLERKINEGPGSQKYEDDLNKQFETALKTREQLEEGGKKIRENIEQAGKAIRSTLEGSYNLLNSSVQESVLAQARSRINFNLFDSGKLRTPGDVFSAAAASDSIRDNQRAIATGRAELVDNSKKLEQNNAELNNLAVQIDTLARKDWKVNVNVNTDSGASSVQLG